ncbi:MAG TPA: ArgE/DapE family deacylase [Ilumatobacteraceae bacterium]
MTDRARATVLQHVEDMTAEMVTELRAVVRIPSISGTSDENTGQSHMAALYSDGGLDVDHWQIDLADVQRRADFPGMEVERDEAWGLVARLPGTGTGDGPSLMLNGHIDVVPYGDRNAWSDDPFSASLREDKLMGRGTCDMKAGLIAAHWAVQAIRRAGIGLRGDLLLASVQGEEDGGLGTYSTLLRGWRADACVIPEPTGLDLVPGNAGALTFRLRIRGHATHASRRTDGVSAIEKFWPVWRALADLETRRHRDIDPATSKFGLTHPLSIGTVRAGDWASSVPDLLVAEGRLGVALGEVVADARIDLERAVAEACDADPWLRDHPVEVEWWGGQFASGQLPADSDLARRVGDAHAIASSGRAQDSWIAPYGSDLRLLTEIGGIPTLQYGPGDAHIAHGPDEFVSIPDVVITARALALVALDVCGVA